MERAAKRPRLADSNEPPQNTHHNHQESSRFDGTGIAVRDGTVQVQGDLYVNSSHAPETNDAISRRKQVLESLRFEQIDARQLSINKALSKTCRWFLNTESYQQWSSRDLGSNDNQFLWIKGQPGAGKSTLMRFLLEHNQSLARRSNSREVLISFFFNARGESLEKSTIGLYRSLLLQLLKACPEAQEVLDDVQPGRPWDVNLLKNLFDNAVQALGDSSIVCFIDALDECEEAQIRDMVQFIGDLVEDGSRLHICFASRHYPHITIHTALSIVLEDQNEHENDIAHYIDARLHLKQGRQAEEIRLELCEKASGVFIWVVLVVEILNKEYEAGRIYALRERLRQLPSNLHKLFHDILIRDTKDRTSLLLCIQWILFSRSPLTPVQLYFALISGAEPAYLAQSHLENYSMDSILRFVLNNSKGLAEPTKSRNPTIQFIHESVGDFLLKEEGLCKIFPELQGNVIGQSHETLKQCCLTYMSMDSVANLRDSIRATGVSFFTPNAFVGARPPLPFLAYANQNVLHHADQAESNGLSQQGFLASFPHSRWVEHHNLLRSPFTYRYSPRVSLRYIMAEAGTSALFRALPTDQSYFDVEDERYGLPVLAAAAAENNETVLTMLELEARCLSNFSFEEFCSDYSPFPSNLNAPSRNFAFDKNMTLLHQLICYGSEIPSLFYLLTKDDFDLRGSGNESLILQALENGFIEVVKLLIDQGANVTATNELGETPIALALHHGYVEVIEPLLDHGADASSTMNDGATVLHEATRLRQIEAAKLLLDHGADASATTIDGITPLHQASAAMQLELAQLLLDYGANPSAQTVYGSTPLHWASQYGHLQVVKLLLDCGADLSAVTENGGTPLHRASQNGHIEVAKLLLDHGAYISATMNNGTTPLHEASLSGHVELAKLLLDHDADILARMGNGATPLHEASMIGHVELAELLLDRGADILAIMEDGRTPLRRASQNSHMNVVRLLLDRGADI